VACQRCPRRASREGLTKKAPAAAEAFLFSVRVHVNSQWNIFGLGYFDQFKIEQKQNQQKNA
jgi:hypothetical protein